MVRNITFLLVFLISLPVVAGDEPEWEVVGDKSFIRLSLPGNVIYGDEMKFVLRRGKCDVAQLAFYISSYEEDAEVVEGKSFEMKIDGENVNAEVQFIFSFASTQIKVAFVNIGLFPVDGLKDWFGEKDNIKTEIDDNNSPEILRVFDIHENSYNTKEFIRAMTEAQSLCLSV